MLKKQSGYELTRISRILFRVTEHFALCSVLRLLVLVANLFSGPASLFNEIHNNDCSTIINLLAIKNISTNTWLCVCVWTTKANIAESLTSKRNLPTRILFDPFYLTPSPRFWKKKLWGFSSKDIFVLFFIKKKLWQNPPPPVFWKICFQTFQIGRCRKPNSVYFQTTHLKYNHCELDEELRGSLIPTPGTLGEEGWF